MVRAMQHNPQGNMYVEAQRVHINKENWKHQLHDVYSHAYHK